MFLLRQEKCKNVSVVAIEITKVILGENNDTINKANKKNI